MIENIKQIIEEYKPDTSIWNEDDERMTKIKTAVSKLNDADKIIFTIYCETGSLRETGKILGVSHSTAFKCIREIKKQILECL